MNNVFNFADYTKNKFSPETFNFPRHDKMNVNAIWHSQTVTTPLFNFLTDDRLLIQSNFTLYELQDRSIVIANNILTIAGLVKNKKVISGIVRFYMREVI